MTRERLVMSTAENMPDKQEPFAELSSIEITEVVSSTIQRLGYDASTSLLYVKFKSGGWYAYKDVPATEHVKLMESESRGKHFHANIRNCYLFARIEADENDLPISPLTRDKEN